MSTIVIRGAGSVKLFDISIIIKTFGGWGGGVGACATTHLCPTWKEIAGSQKGGHAADSSSEFQTGLSRFAVRVTYCTVCVKAVLKILEFCKKLLKKICGKEKTSLR